MVAKSGRGIRVTDVDGNEFLDFAAGIAVNSTGHCHPEVVKAIQDQAAELIHMSGTDFYYQNMTTFAERLSAIAPMPGPHKFYTATPAPKRRVRHEARRYHTGRQNIIASSEPSTAAPWERSRSPAQAPAEAPLRPLRPGVHHIRYPTPIVAVPTARHRSRKPSPSTAPATSKTASSRHLPPEEVAAIILEPIQGEGGYVVAPTNS